MLKLPTEIRMLIFSYLLPDRPVSAWLDHPLRNDGQRCVFNLLLLNKQITEEARDVLYGNQPFTVSIQKNSLYMCGRLYYLDVNGAPFNQTRNGMFYNRPPMLDKVRSIRIQMTLVKPSVTARRHRLRRDWNEEVEIYDLRDSVQGLVYMLQTINTLHSISLVLVTQNTTSVPWTDAEQFHHLKTIAEPFQYLRGIPKVKLEAVYQVQTSHRLNVTQYILDKISNTSREGNGLAKPDEYFLSNEFAVTGSHPELKVAKILHNESDFQLFRTHWEALIRLPGPHITPPSTAHEVFSDFSKAQRIIEGHFMGRLPKGKDWLLHRARVFREKGDVEGIRSLRLELVEKVQQLIKEDREGTDAKERIVEAAMADRKWEMMAEAGSGRDGMWDVVDQ